MTWPDNTETWLTPMQMHLARECSGLHGALLFNLEGPPLIAAKPGWSQIKRSQFETGSYVVKRSPQRFRMMQPAGKSVSYLGVQLPWVRRRRTGKS